MQSLNLNSARYWRAIIFTLLIFFSGSSANAYINNYFTGPDNSIAGRIENYSYTFSNSPSDPYLTLNNATLSIVGGVFVSPSGTTSTTMNAIVNGITPFRVQWQNSGTITSRYSINTPSGPLYGLILTKNVTVVTDVPNVSLSINDPNGLGRNKIYTATSSNAQYYQWQTTGDVSIVSANGASATIQTGASFTTGTIQVRGRNSGDWSVWKSVALNFDCSTPSAVRIAGDHDYDHIYYEDYSYKFHAIATNALEYQWEVVENSSKVNIHPSDPTTFDIKLLTGFKKVVIRMRARKNCDWSAWAYYEIYQYSYNPSDPCSNAPVPTNIYITTTLDNQTLCEPKTGTATIHADGAYGYAWFIQNGCMTSFGLSCTTQSGGPYSNSSVNFTMNPSTIGSSFSTEIAVYVFYCNGAKYIQANKIISGNKLNCAKQNTSEDMHIEDTEVTTGKLLLYPNPTQDILHIKDCENIRIINSQGQVVKEITNGMEAIDVKDLIKGLYIVQGTRNGNPVSSIFQKE